MSGVPTGIEYLISLYNGYQAIAERADIDQLRFIHVKTKLDEKIVEWLRAGWDIVLTGNPGDGKTHLMNFLDLPANIRQEKDASQKQAQEVLQAWRASRRAGDRFLLAINHAPLRRLAEATANDSDLDELHDMVLPAKRSESSVDNFVVYSEEQKTNSSNSETRTRRIKLVDLSQREILTEEIISGLLDKLCPLAAAASCAAVMDEECSRCPIHDNAQALLHTQVRHNLAVILSLVARRGFHATMRDLVGLLAFILSGGATCEELWRRNVGSSAPSYDTYDYFNLLYQGGRNPLFDALRRTFDPGIYADPRVDLQLWAGHMTNGWLVSGSSGSTNSPHDLIELRSLKRRYFFEHDEPVNEKLQRMMTDVEQRFGDLLRQTDSEMAVQDLVEMINLFYAPLTSSQHRNYHDRLYLWNQHRYSIGQPPGYVAMRSLGANLLHIYRPKLNPAYDNAMTVRQDHVLLAVNDWLPGEPALRVDWEMFKALWEAKQGKAIEVQPYSILRRLDLFLRSLGPEAGNWAAVETIHWGDYKKQRLVSMKVNRRNMTYQE